MTSWNRIPTRVLYAVLALAFALPARGDHPPSRRPNILLIVADDLGWADVGWHGEEIETPNLDALAASGVRLEGHYVFPTCSPTRTALLTGRNPSRFGILGPISGRSELAVPKGTLTLADALAARGYATALCGKWHLGLRPEVGPRQFGFASTYGYLHGQIDPYTHRYKNGDVSWHRNDHFQEERGHATDLIAAEAIRRIEAGRDGASPFLIEVAFSVPHAPIAEEERWQKPYATKIAEPSRRLYAAAVTHMDAAIGQVVAALERTGQRDDTLILFTSDNGGPSKGESEKNYEGRYGPLPVLANNKPLRGWKGEVFEGGIRVPAFLNWRGTLSARVVNAPISVLDWAPTLTRLAGAPVDARAGWEGIDVWPQLVAMGPSAPRTLYWKTAQASAIREGDWKLVVSSAKNTKESHLLFDLARDPYEAKNLANQEPERVAHLRELLRRQQALDPKG